MGPVLFFPWSNPVEGVMAMTFPLPKELVCPYLSYMVGLLPIVVGYFFLLVSTTCKLEGFALPHALWQWFLLKQHMPRARGARQNMKACSVGRC